MSIKDSIKKSVPAIKTTARRKRQLETINSVQRLTPNIYMLDYKDDYDIDEIIEKGSKSITDIIKFVSKRSHLNPRGFYIGEAQGGGCTTFNSVTPEGNFTLSRNFDFKNAPCFVLWTHPKNHYESIAVVDNNFLAYGTYVNKYCKFNSRQLLLAPFCCVDGMNECGLAVAVLQIKAKATNQNEPGKKDISTTTMIRAVLDTCADVEEAIEFIKSYNMHDSLGCCYHYQLLDKTGRSVVVEYIGNKLRIYEKNGEKYTTEGSVYEGEDFDNIYVSNFSITKELNGFEVEQHGEDRCEAVINTLKNKRGKLTEREAMDLLSYVKLNYDHPKYPWRIVALWSAVYNSSERTVSLAAGMDYSQIFKFAVNKPCEVISKYAIEDSEYPNGEWAYL